MLDYRIFTILISTLTAVHVPVILETKKHNYSLLHIYFSDVIYMNKRFKSLFLGAVMLISLSSSCLQNDLQTDEKSTEIGISSIIFNKYCYFI